MKIKYLFRNEKAALYIAILLIAFGAAEVITGLRHEFFGLVTSEDAATSIIGSGLGLCYLFAGVLLLIFSIRTLFISIILLIIDVLGRFIMMFSGMYPMDTTMQIIGMVGGTVIAVIFASFIFVKYLRMLRNQNGVK